MECPKSHAVNPDWGQFCGQCGGDLHASKTRLQRKHYVAIVLVAILVLLVIGYVNGSSSSDSGTHIGTGEYQRALQKCENAPGAEGVAAHPDTAPPPPGASAHSPAVATGGLAKKSTPTPSDLPNKP